tara:strand:- start:3205 stop:3489 length:285 start_codon:yes stop_codon:yes gene_type:complete
VADILAAAHRVWDAAQPRAHVERVLKQALADMANPGEFIRQVRQEASKVTWPTRKETTITTIMVFIMVFLAAIFFFVVDQVLAVGVRFILGLGG